MTNDNTAATGPFAEAARAEGLRLWPGTDFGHLPARFAFMDGAEWARDYLAAHVPQVTIVQEDGQPATCEVRQGGVLIFAGRDHSADLRVAAQEPTDAEVLAAREAVREVWRKQNRLDLGHVGLMEAYARAALTAARKA